MKISSISLTLVLSFIGSVLTSKFGFEYHKFDRRQDISACATQCAWAANLASCSETDFSCFCNAVEAGGSNVAACATCLQPINATFSSSIQDLETVCAGSPAVTGTTSLTGITTGNPTSCASQCSNIATALTSCADVVCFCPTLLASGAACSQCFATVNVTEASLLSVAISQCQTVPTVTNTGGATQCSSQCGLVYLAATSCSDNSCFCPTVLAQGPQCSSCWATVNITEANAIGSILTGCQTAIYPKTTSSTGGNVATLSLNPSSTSTSKSAAYPVRGVFGDFGGTMGMQFVMLIALVAGLLSLFA